jgi:hypothetical protein
MNRWFVTALWQVPQKFAANNRRARFHPSPGIQRQREGLICRNAAAVRFLCEKGRVSPRRIGAVGYGEFRPIADNSQPEWRAQNRRIALVFLSEELAGSDAVPTATVATNLVERAPAITNAPASSAIAARVSASTNIPVIRAVPEHAPSPAWTGAKTNQAEGKL